MLLSELINDIEVIKIIGKTNVSINKIIYDSRKAVPSSMFVCLTGIKFDGHNFASLAFERGCRVFLCERPLDLPKSAVQVITDNSRKSLAVISAAFYSHPADKIKVIGITGTKGKTTTALLLTSILNNSGKSAAYIGSNGVIIRNRTIETVNTTPESLELHHYLKIMVDSGIEYAVIEVSSQALDRWRVYKLPFIMTMFLNLSPDHIGKENGEHESFEEYKNAKSKLFSEYDTPYVICNSDDKWCESVVSGTHGKIITFGTSDNSDFRGKKCVLFRDAQILGINFSCLHNKDSYQYKMMLPGLFNMYNGLAAISAAVTLGADHSVCQSTLEKTPVTGRFEIIPGRHGRTYIIDYAHNKISLTSALLVLREYSPKRIICVFGSVGERTKLRRAELAHVASNMADYNIITSDNPNYEPASDIINDIVANYDGPAPYETIVDRREAIRRAIELSEEGDIVLFAGKGHENYQLIDGIKRPFSERQIIEDECSRISYIHFSND